MGQKYNFSVVACARWETRFIAEWLSFYKFLGFDHIYLYCNDDDPRELYEAAFPFVASGFVDFFHFGIPGQQEQMYMHFLKNFKNETEWFVFIDIDEFILLRKHNNIIDFVEAWGKEAFDVMHLFSLNAGHNGFENEPAGSVIANFNRRSAQLTPFTKALFRASSIDDNALDAALGSAFWHNATAIIRPEARVVSPLGQDMRDYYFAQNENWRALNIEHSFQERIIDLIFLYHVGFKSKAYFEHRIKRGLKGDFQNQVTWSQALNQPGYTESLLAPLNEVEENRLIELREKMLSQAFSRQIAKTPPKLKNAAHGGAATQSSVCEWSRFPDDIEKDAHGLIDGLPGPYPRHHTATELEPWWQVDLQRLVPVREIHFYNRVDGMRDRQRNFTVSYHTGDGAWRTLFDKNDDIPFGGVDGRAFILGNLGNVEIRVLRVIGKGTCALEFSQIEVYSDAKD